MLTRDERIPASSGALITVPSEGPRKRLSKLLKPVEIQVSRTRIKGKKSLGIVVEVNDPGVLQQPDRFERFVARAIEKYAPDRMIVVCEKISPENFVLFASNLEKGGITRFGDATFGLKQSLADAAADIARWRVRSDVRGRPLQSRASAESRKARHPSSGIPEMAKVPSFVGDTLQGADELGMDLRDADTGRLDARKVAELFGMSVAEIANIMGKKRQSLSKNPTSKSAQPVLEMFERISRLRAFPQFKNPGEFRKWFKKPLPLLGNQSAYESVLVGNLERPAEIVDRLLTGDFGG